VTRATARLLNGFRVAVTGHQPEARDFRGWTGAVTHTDGQGHSMARVSSSEGEVRTLPFRDDQLTQEGSP